MRINIKKSNNYYIYKIAFIIFILSLLNCSYLAFSNHNNMWLSNKYRIKQINEKGILIFIDNIEYFKYVMDESILKIVPNPKKPYIAIFSTTEDLSLIENSNKDERKIPLSYFVENLYIIDIELKEIIQYIPEGNLYFDDWCLNFWSSKGSYAYFAQDHYGPIHIVKTNNIMKYISKQKQPYRIVHDDKKPARVHKFLGWDSDGTFKYSSACCGVQFTHVCQVGTGECKIMKTKKF